MIRRPFTLILDTHVLDSLALVWCLASEERRTTRRPRREIDCMLAGESIHTDVMMR